MIFKLLCFFTKLVVNAAAESPEAGVVNTASEQAIQTDENILEIPLYMAETSNMAKIKNAIFLGVTATVIFIPFNWLKNVKYNMVAVCGLIMALNHFGVYSKIIESMNSFTPENWGVLFLNTIVFVTISLLNMFFKIIRIITSSCGGAYVLGYVTCLCLNMLNKITVACFMGGFVVMYAIMYFLLKKSRKFLLFSTLAGWNIYAILNIFTNCSFILKIYSDNKKDRLNGILVMAGVILSSIIVYGIIRLIFRKKKQNKK
ncbi:hypothetical protein EHP00_1796 [Ecytonucleospora hepatopenaei]|uniref:Uncharacterized protein n=1 Tax=Ecytonucleospora hepatopenaei TaxID=646526 RepID=A0A1W0E4C5_9MICR|nr:hypothetical protein EHP00_1796 [Ecytonucleospora hepatopenaei]